MAILRWIIIQYKISDPNVINIFTLKLMLKPKAGYKIHFTQFLRNFIKSYLTQIPGNVNWFWIVSCQGLLDFSFLMSCFKILFLKTVKFKRLQILHQKNDPFNENFGRVRKALAEIFTKNAEFSRQLCFRNVKSDE